MFKFLYHFFICNHSLTTRPFTDEKGTYMTCMECGERIDCLVNLRGKEKACQVQSQDAGAELVRYASIENT